MYTKHHNSSCDRLHFATFMFLLVHRLRGCHCGFLCTRLKAEVVDAEHTHITSEDAAGVSLFGAFKSKFL